MDRLSRVLSDWLGRSTAFFALGVLPLIVWAAFGPVTHYSDTWQLVINTGTTILTWLLALLIQRSQNAHSFAIQLKLDELIRSIKDASNTLIAAEELPETELQRLKRGRA